MQANMSDLCFVLLSFSNCVSVYTCNKTLRQAYVFMNKYLHPIDHRYQDRGGGCGNKSVAVNILLQVVTKNTCSWNSCFHCFINIPMMYQYKSITCSRLHE